MDFIAELTRANFDTNLISRLSAYMFQAQNDAEAKDKELSLKNAELYCKDTKIAALTLELAYYKRLRFAHKSESFTAEQGELFNETWQTDIEAMHAEVEQLTPPTARAKRPRAGRQPLPEKLERIEHRHEPESCECQQCGAHLIKIGEDVSEQLDIEPARFFVHRHIRPQYACRTCATVTAEPIPPAVIDSSVAAPGLLTWVITQKYLDHLPLYRIEQISQRYGVPIARSTLAEWVGRIGVALQPLADRLAELLRQRTVLHADETPIQQLDPGKGKTKRAYLWAYRSNSLEADPPIILFDYQTSRSGQHAQQFLSDWQGHLMVDDYAGYKALFHAERIELACWAHARRKFYDLFAANQSPIAVEALKQIRELYAIEEQIKHLDSANRHRWRRKQAQPLLTSFHAWLKKTRQTSAEGGGLARAIDYSLKRWPALQRYADSGHLPIDNNPVENAIRPIAIGKKNWLFAGSERAGKRAAAIQSLLATAKLNGIEPAAWLKDTLEKLPTCPNSRIDELLPLRST